jgi:hypothetical protein
MVINDINVLGYDSCENLIYVHIFDLTGSFSIFIKAQVPESSLGGKDVRVEMVPLGTLDIGITPSVSQHVRFVRFLAVEV